MQGKLNPDPGSFPHQWCPCARGLIAGLPAGLLTGAGNATGFQEQQLNTPEAPGGTCKPQFPMRLARCCPLTCKSESVTRALAPGRQRHDHALKHVLPGALFAQLTARRSKELEEGGNQQD